MKHKATLKLDADGDLSPEAFRDNSGLLDGRAATEQELKVLLQTVRGEDPFDRQHGFRVFEVVTQPVSVLRREVRLALKQDDRVERVVDVTVETDAQEVRRDRNVSVSVHVELSSDTSDIQLEAEI